MQGRSPEDEAEAEHPALICAVKSSIPDFGTFF